MKVKVIVLVVWAAFALTLCASLTFSPVSGQASGAAFRKVVRSALPDASLINRFDRAIQQRFLSEPNFGIRRIMPVNPPNPHLEQFSPKDEEERSSAADFEKGGWRVGLYLFGRRAMPKLTGGEGRKEFVISYRLNKPLPVTGGLEERRLPKAEKLLREVKAAFLKFQNPNSPHADNYEFSIGEWSYVARPVRAVNESCLRCHADYVVTESLGDKQYKVRKRRVGDANGVIVYGFAKDD